MSHRRIGMGVLLAVCVCACHAQEATKQLSEGTHEVAPRETRLSDALPEQLGNFVLRFGEDRTLTPSETEAMTNLELLADDPQAVIDLLQPRDYFVLYGTWEVVGAEEEGTSSRLVAGSSVLMAESQELGFGGVLLPGDVVERGLILNAGDADVHLRALESGEGVTIEPGHGALLAKKKSCMESCSVTCRSGYFACCWVEDSCAYCNCLAAGAGDDEYQGLVSMSCSASVGAPAKWNHGDEDQ